MTAISLVLEKNASYTDHDRLFKELIQTFFAEFLELFFPEHHELIDFSHMKFLEQEVFTDILKGEKRRIDILVETKYKGKDTILLIHVEPQATYQKEFNERMFIYFSRLYEKHRKPILPIAVFSYNDKRDVPKQYCISTPTFKINEFNYLQIHLIKMNWREFIRQTNPIAAALLSKMGYLEEERIQVKLEFLRMLSKMQINPAKMKLIYGFFETYLQLDEKEESLMREEITKWPEEDANRVLKLPNSYFEKGVEKGIEQGIEQVICEMLNNGLSESFISEVTSVSIQKIRALKNMMKNQLDDK